MDFWTLTMMMMAVGSIYYHFKKKLSYFKDRGVPYEPGLPIFGNMATIIFRIKSFSKMISDIYKANPDAKYIGAFNFGTPAIILRDPELIKTITIKHFDRFQNHSMAVDVEVDPLFGRNLFNINGEHWREARSILSPAFTSSKLKSMFKLMVECSKNFNNFLSKLSEKERKELSAKDLFTKYTTDVIATCAFGVDVNSFENPKNDFYVLGRKSVIFEGFLMFKFYMASVIPGLMKLFNVRVVDDNVARFFKNTISHVIKTREKEGISRPDMIQLMMDARKSAANISRKLDIDAMTANAFSFFIGGFDTTSTQMCIIAHELAINPDIQRNLQSEIDKVSRKTNGEPSYEALLDMPYLDAVFNESLRRHTDLVILDRVCEKPLELPPALPGGKPFVIQPGMIVWISGKSIHMDPKYYNNPEKFEPERYYKKKITMNDEFNLSFGIGPRSCIGYRFAKLETKILFFYLLSEFSLIPIEGTKSPIIVCKDSMKVKPWGGFRVAIKRRNKNDLWY